MIKAALKKILPLKLQKFIRQSKARILLEHQYKGMSNEHIFDNIYVNGVWGKDEHGNATSGSGSQTQYIVDSYVAAVKTILEENDIRTMVDLGCGDFNVGSRFLDLCDKYVACDISNVILEANKQKFKFDHLEFKKLDLTVDMLPIGDIAFVRQVLQHLSNHDVKRFVDKLNQEKHFKYLLVTEHLPAVEPFEANLDKPSGPNIRVGIKSGVVLHESPFFLKFKSMREVLVINEPNGGIDAIIKTTLYQL